jgi:hypothetical protein
MTTPLDWNALLRPIKAKPKIKRPPNTITFTVIDFSKAILPFGIAYSWFHKSMDGSARAARLMDDILVSRGDQDRLHFAEEYAGAVLAITDLADAMWFRRGVMRKETLPSTRYPRQRDHTIHTLHNYLLGWYFFINSATVNQQFRAAFAARGLRIDDDSTILRFGELWCFVSLLHDIGYLFEGEIPNESMALVDQGIREGIDWVSEYFQEIFWAEWKLRGADERETARRLTQFAVEPTIQGSAGRIIQFLRDIGPLEQLEAALKTAMGQDLQGIATLPRDAFRVWATNYRTYGQPQMAERIDGLEEALYSLVEKGMPETAIRILDHGICGALLLLKYSTYWFRFFFALQQARPRPGSAEAEMHGRLQSQLEGQPPYRAAHWWRSVVWATGAVALHNVQQCPNIPGWKGKLELSDDPLAYLGILVDILQEWDRHSAKRIPAVESNDRIINSADVSIGRNASGKVCIRYGCRDDNAVKRDRKMRRDLSAALIDWDKLVEISFESI